MRAKTSSTAKRAVRSLIAAPGIRQGLRWFINSSVVPSHLRDRAHRKLAKRALFGEGSVFDYRTDDGVALRFLHTGTANYLYWRNEYERETTSLFCTLARGARTVLDIGSADGLYAIFAAAVNPGARIIAFEPGEASARTLARNLELNAAVTANVQLHRLALGDRDEIAQLYVAGESGGTSSLNPEFRADRRAQTVRVRRGDSLLAELAIDCVDLMKIDTESTEPAVLGGFTLQLERSSPDIICEVLHGRTEPALERTLQVHRYRYFWVGPRGLERRTTIEGDPTYRSPNFLFTKRSDAELAGLGVRLS